jgi:hypothetical protein
LLRRHLPYVSSIRNWCPVFPVETCNNPRIQSRNFFFFFSFFLQDIFIVNSHT